MQTAPTLFAERRLAMLERLAELGMVMAERLAATTEPTGDEALKFLRVAKAVRQTLALHAQMEAEFQAEAIRIVEREARARNAEVARRKGRIITAVERLIEAETSGDDDRCDALTETFDEWRVDREDEDFGLDKTFGEAVAAICKMLGLAPDWRRYADEAWAEDIFTAQGCRRDASPTGRSSSEDRPPQQPPSSAPGPDTG